jgi:spoIIIJ-associated protein
MDSIERSGKTVEEAVEEALRYLNTTIDKVDITVIDQGSKGFLGIGGRPAKISAVLKFDPEKTAKDFLKEVSLLMGLAVDINTKLSDKHLEVELKGSNLGVLIGKRGQTLDSLQYLVNLVVNKGNAPYISVTLDTENYRKKRKETLETLAHNLAKKAKHTRRNVILDPMNPYERRIIHAALQNDKYVTTYSQGDEPFRNVVISPNRNN